MKQTLEFLSNLKINNTPSWFMDHIGDYERAKTQIADLAYLVTEQLVQIDDKLNTEIEVERFISTLGNFQNKKGPSYLTFFEIAINPMANDGNEPVYLLHIDPEGSYISIRYNPDVFGIQVMRNYISKNVDLLENMLEDMHASGFILENNSAMRSAPKGYQTGIKGEAFLKLQQYNLKSPIDLLKGYETLIPDIVFTFRSALPFIKFLRNGLGL